jgi:hypothetical protein
MSFRDVERPPPLDFPILVIGPILKGPGRPSFTRNEADESPRLRPAGFGTWKLARRRLAIQVNSRYYSLTSGYSLS